MLARTPWWYERHPGDHHDRNCEHCRWFRRKVEDGEFRLADREISCHRCTFVGTAAIDERYARSLNISLVRCARCGTPEGESHVVELAWSEVPDRGLETGWGGNDIWDCSLGCELPVDGEDEAAAQEHANQMDGLFLPAFAGSNRTFKRSGADT